MTDPAQLASPGADALSGRRSRIAAWFVAAACPLTARERSGAVRFCGGSGRRKRIRGAALAEPSTHLQLPRRWLRSCGPIADGRAGYGARCTALMRQVRRDFRAVYDGACTPAERLALMLRHTAYDPSDDEREAATAFLARPECQDPIPVYTLIASMERVHSLARLAGAVREGFALKRHRIDDWRLIYGLIGCCGTNAAAEFGVTEVAVNKVAERVATSRGIREGSAIEAFLHAATNIRVVPLESAFGRTRDIFVVKNAWRRAAVQAGLIVRPGVNEDGRTASAVLREWPGTDWLMTVGVPVSAFAGTDT